MSNTKIIANRSDIVAIADAVRNKTGSTKEMTLGGIASAVNSITSGGSADPVLQDKTVTPTTSQQTITADSGYDGLDTVTVNAIQTETKTATPTTSQQNITPTSGKYLTQVTVNAMPAATQATPAITIDSTNGLITATATQTAGYVAAGTKSATKQLAFKPATTITPGTANQTAVAANTYVGGAITVKGDSNLVASNIVSGKSIFGVVGTAPTGGSSGGGGDTSVEDGLITKTVTTYTNDRVTSIGKYAFYSYTSLTTVSFPACTTISNCAFQYCSSLTTISFPACTTIGNNAFAYCSKLTTVSFPACTTIGSSAFQYCSSLTTISFPACTTIVNDAFAYCSKLTTVSFPACTTIGSFAFYNCTSLTKVSFPACTSIDSFAFRFCSSLTTIYLMNSSICKLLASTAFSNTGIWSDKGSIFVPTSLLASYKAATNWVFFSKRIFGV